MIIQRIGELSIFLSLLLVIFYSLNYRRFDDTLKSFYFYLLIWFLTEFFALYILLVHKLPNLFLYHFFYIAQFITLSFFYYFLLRIRAIKWIAVVILIFIMIQHILEPGLFHKVNHLGLFLTCLALIGYAMAYFFRLLAVEKTIYLYVNLGIFLNTLVTVLVFATSNFVTQEVFSSLLKFNIIFNLIFQVLVLIEWFKHHRHFKK